MKLAAAHMDQAMVRMLKDSARSRIGTALSYQPTPQMGLGRPVSGLNLPWHFGPPSEAYDQDSECMRGGANDSLWDKPVAEGRRGE